MKRLLVVGNNCGCSPDASAFPTAAIRYHLLEPLARVFMRYRPPLLDGIPETEASLYGSVVDAGYALLDAMLGGDQ